MIRGRTLLVSLVFVFLAMARSAQAVPILLGVDPGLTNLTIALSSSAGDATSTLEVSGSIDSEVLLIDHAIFGPVASQLELISGGLAASHDPLSIFGAGVSLTFTSVNLGMSVVGPSVSATPVAPGFSVADFYGYSAALDAGTLLIVGNVFAEPIDIALDLEMFPLILTLPLNSVGQIRVIGGAPGTLDVAVLIPVDAGARLVIAGLEVDLTLAGNVALSGTIIPEPSTALLLGTGLMLLSVARRSSRSG